jgi:hypothetical protein
MLLLVIYSVSLMEFAITAIRCRTFKSWPLATGLVTGLGAVLVLLMSPSGDPSSASNFLPVAAVGGLVALPIAVIRFRKLLWSDSQSTSTETPEHGERPVEQRAQVDQHGGAS